MKKLLCAVISGVMLLSAAAVFPPSAASAVFQDVEEDRWSAGAIGYAGEKGYMLGTSEGFFSPDRGLTRAEAVTVIWRREGSPEPEGSVALSDVEPGSWYEKACAWAYEKGVALGVGGSLFDPDGKVTREQLAAMLFRYSAFCPVFVPDRADLSVFGDAGSASAWAEDALGWAVEAGLLEGVGESKLAPAGGATREQFAAMIERFDAAFTLEYRAPVLKNEFSAKPYPLVTDADFYVAVDGDDGDDGSFAHPFATWGRAVVAVRKLKKTKPTDITVAFMAGDYGPLSVTLTDEDSGSETQRITYCAYGDGDVVFNNGFDVDENDFTPVSGEEKAWFLPSVSDRIMKADVSGKLTSYDPLTSMVMNDDGVCILARFPNLYPDGTDRLFEKAGETIDEDHILIDFQPLKRRIDGYHTADGLLLYGYLTTGWYKDLLETDEYDPASGVFHIPYPEKARMGKLRMLPEFDSRWWNKTAIVNVSEELDSAGEYWIDGATGTFYVYEPSGSYHFTGGDTMVRVDSARYITFDRLNFRNSDGAMINATGHPRGMTVEGCTFRGCTADPMVDIRGGTCVGEPLDVTVRDSEFSVCTSTALGIQGINDEDFFGTSTGVLVDNNCFTLACLRIGNKAALSIGVSAPVISHNIFRKCYWIGIAYGSPNMIAEYNVFDEVCYNGDDVGALQNWRNVRESGNIVRYNLFKDIRGGTNGRYGLYLDGSSGMTVESNIFWRCACPVMNNGLSKLNYVKNNVFLSPESGISECPVHAEGQEVVAEALITGDYSEVLSDYGYTAWKGAFDFFDAHPEAKARAQESWPGFFDVTLDLDRISEPEFCLNSTVECTGNISVKKDGEFGENEAENVKYSKFEDNRVFRPDENPVFVNPTVGDYRIREGVDFPDIRFDKIGRYASASDGAMIEKHENRDGGGIEYVVRYPAGLKAGEKRPLLIFLHGSGTCGGGFENLLANSFFTEIDKLEDFPFIALVPHVEETDLTWLNMNREMSALIQEAVRWDFVDPDRVYMMGTSLGGEGTWFYTMRFSDLIAAAVPICGSGSVSSAYKLKNVPVWAHHGELDEAMPYQNSVDMVDAINAAGGDARLTTYRGVGHGIWDDVYSNPAVYEWLLSIKKN